MKFKVTLNFLL